MGKVIILEGPDGSGKTTLAKQLSANYAYEYVHFGPPTSDNVLETYATALYDALNGEDDVVFDRLHVGERIYGKIVRDNDKLTRHGEVLMNRLMKATDTLLVFCLPEYEVSYANWKRRHRTELVKDHVDYGLVYAGYNDRAFSPMYAWAARYDYMKMGLDEACSVLHHLKRPLATLPEGVIGDPRARYLFIGDVANQRYLDLPFFALNNCSGYLNDCLEDAGFTEDNVAFTNARYLDKTPRNLRAIWDAMGKPKVCALGSQAWQRCLVNHVPCTTVPHPAFWKRFHASKRGDYVAALRKVITG